MPRYMYVKHNIFHKKSQNMIFHVLSVVPVPTVLFISAVALPSGAVYFTISCSPSAVYFSCSHSNSTLYFSCTCSRRWQSVHCTSFHQVEPSRKLTVSASLHSILVRGASKSLLHCLTISLLWLKLFHRDTSILYSSLISSNNYHIFHIYYFLFMSHYYMEFESLTSLWPLKSVY